MPPELIPGSWRECPGCDTYLCTAHGVHTWDCECPPIEEWGSLDPYGDPLRWEDVEELGLHVPPRGPVEAVSTTS